MARAKAQAPKRLTGAQLRALASRGQTGRSTISSAAAAQRRSVATSSLRQPQRQPQPKIIRRTISDSVSIKSKQTVKPIPRVIITKRRNDGQTKPKTQSSSIPKPKPQVITRGQERQRQVAAAQRQPFVFTFEDLKTKTIGFVDKVDRVEFSQEAKDSGAQDFRISEEFLIGSNKVIDSGKGFLDDFFKPRDNISKKRRKGGSF